MYMYLYLNSFYNVHVHSYTVSCTCAVLIYSLYVYVLSEPLTCMNGKCYSLFVSILLSLPNIVIISIHRPTDVEGVSNQSDSTDPRLPQRQAIKTFLHQKPHRVHQMVLIRRILYVIMTSAAMILAWAIG